MSQMKEKTSPKRLSPLHGVIIFVSQQLISSRTALHQQCTSLGGKFVWVFDLPFTHYVCQGKLSKKSKEYKKAEEFRATCVHPAWLKACHTVRQHVAEKLYAPTYNPNRSLSFVSNGDDDDDDDDEDEENHCPSLTTRIPQMSNKSSQSFPIPTKFDQKQKKRITPISLNQVTTPSVMTIKTPATDAISNQKLESPIQSSNEAELMLNDLESSIAQYLRQNSNSTTVNSTRSSTTDDDIARRPLSMIRPIGSVTELNEDPTLESSMRVEWLDDAMRAERKKIVDEDELNIANSQQTSRNVDMNLAKKRPLTDSNTDTNSLAKKCRI